MCRRRATGGELSLRIGFDVAGQQVLIQVRDGHGGAGNGGAAGLTDVAVEFTRQHLGVESGDAEAQQDCQGRPDAEQDRVMWIQKATRLHHFSEGLVEDVGRRPAPVKDRYGRTRASAW